MSAIDEEQIGDLVNVVRTMVSRDLAGVRRPGERAHGFDRDLWRDMAQVGLFGLMVPEELQGTGAGEGACTAVARELGRAGCQEPFVAAGVLTPHWLAQGSRAGRDLLELIMKGERVVAPAWEARDGGAGFDGTALPVRARTTGRRLSLDGCAHWVHSPGADDFAVVARMDGTVVVVRVDPSTAGVTLLPQRMADGTSVASLRLDAVDVAEEDVLAEGEQVVRSGIRTAVTVLSAEILGAMDRMLALTLDHLTRRRQFGAPIGSFQALQHKVVDLWIQQQLTEAALRGTVAGHADPTSSDQERERLTCGLKARAAGAGLRMGGQTIQLHGAIGFTDEYELAHHVNRTMVLAATFGNARAHLRRYDLLSRSAAAGDAA